MYINVYVLLGVLSEIGIICSDPWLNKNKNNNHEHEKKNEEEISQSSIMLISPSFKSL